MPQSEEDYYTQDRIIQLCKLLHNNKTLRFNAWTKTGTDTGYKEGLTIGIKGDLDAGMSVAQTLHDMLAPLAVSGQIERTEDAILVHLESGTTHHLQYSQFVRRMKHRLELEWLDQGILPAIREALPAIAPGLAAVEVDRTQTENWGPGTILLSKGSANDEAWKNLAEEAQKYNAVPMNKVSAEDLKRWLEPFKEDEDTISGPYKPTVNFLAALLKAKGQPLPAAFETTMVTR